MPAPKKLTCKHSDPTCSACVNARAAQVRYKSKNRVLHRAKARERRRAEWGNRPEHLRALAREHYARNREILQQRNREAYHTRDREAYAAGRRKRQGILDAERVPEVFNLQGCVCAICRADSPGGRGGWHADHDHSTGLLRGVLCHFCNTGLGSFKDSIERLTKALEYLTTPPAQSAQRIPASC